jgi:two-component system CitB family response regulator
VIRTLIVDDDPNAVSIHREFVDRLPGFTTVATSTSGTEAVRLADEQRPDLLLLDMYLPDLSGLEVLRALRASGRSPIDVIAITSAKDVDVLRGAMALGVVHYIVKPFGFRAFRERLENYATARSRLAVAQAPGQREVDRIFALLRSGSDDMLPKGISAATLKVVVDILRSAEDRLTAGDLATHAGFSESVARRYLKFLSDSGDVEYHPRYGSAGRPEHLYSWTGSV